ncbi:MAG: aldo/keto reductase [Verrucomicrobiae bacterium]|nr:aldo/keto reductase [Verrucomicrobiae bacterium]
MNYRRFGRTNLQMPVISCGGMRYQHKWTDVDWKEVPAANQDNLEATIHRAIELGINHIETARGYGSSEMQLGRVLPKLPRNKIIVQTKVAPFATQKEFFDTFEKSMKYLQLDHVDLLTIHGINNDEMAEFTLRTGGCLEAAQQIQKQGRTRFIGFSTHAAPRIVHKAIETDAFEYINLHWYFVNHLNWGCVEAAAKRDMGVFIISPNDKGGKLYSPPKKLVDLCKPLSPMQFNDLYCLSRPQVHTLSCGAARPADFDEHVRALDYYDRIPETIAPIEKRLRAEMASVLSKEWCDRWHEGLPEYIHTPGQVNVSEIVRLWTYAKSLDMVEWGKFRYNLLSGGGGHWFPGDNAGKLNEADLRVVLEKSPFAEKLPAILREAHQLLFDAPKKRLSQS